ncbi:hypothetical protein ACJ2_17670 [Pantoea sp. QMID2]|nr:hypothetical protein ACJ1_24010 [Pantoea sp. QMID1]GME40472.1 hypothetical protein ACJ3_25670 [Pantoea sp. QMID3]GME54876.1 hypothetical protein ACJ4_17640 [Pantoea sp. QMID4]GME55880.1 hypothetical protein ACJ2_17670 [Pantoea sp. QMID2]
MSINYFLEIEIENLFFEVTHARANYSAPGKKLKPDLTNRVFAKKTQENRILFDWKTSNIAKI